MRLEAKPFAMGVRIEHPQPLIDRHPVRPRGGPPKLPAAPYRLAFTPADGRGAFSFCMCPGGWIVPAATEADGVVVNGMSLSRRDSPYANSGLVVAVELADLDRPGWRVRSAASSCSAGSSRRRHGRRRRCCARPATRATDFVRGRASSTVPST